MDGFRIAGLILAAWCALVCTGFIIDYARLSRGAWRRYAEGWYMMLSKASLGALLYFFLFGRLFGDSTLRRIIGLVLFAGLAVVLPWLWVLMRRSQRRASTVDVSEGGASDGTAT